MKLQKIRITNARCSMENDIPSEALNMIGIEKEHHYDVTKKDIKRFAQAIDDPNPLYYDEDYAKMTKYKSIVAPLLFSQVFAFEDVHIEELQKDGSPIEMNVPLPAKRTVGGGSIYEFFDRIRPGDRVTVNSKVKDIYTKQGKSGVLYFVVVETIYSNQYGKKIAKETATFIKRI